VRALAGLLTLLLAAACSVATAKGPPLAASEAGPAPEELQAPEPEPEPDPPREPARCGGILKQGGILICRGAPGDVFRIGGTDFTAGPDGHVQHGLSRLAPGRLAILGPDLDLVLEIAPRQDERRTVTGVDCDKVDARTPEQKAHAARSWELKQAAFATFEAGPGAAAGFAPPSAAPRSSPFGPVRRYTGVSKTTGAACSSESVHLGLDFAAPVGSPVLAPAPGIVTLADPDLYYEGGTIFLDHGHGLVSVFMHLSEVGVMAGQPVSMGELIGRSGNTGRSSGPHLHWGVKWRNPVSSDRDSDVYIDPALLLDLPPAD
jgi:murein DD-endopeptidase MepM/ murein hydrolase activator NlpD